MPGFPIRASSSTRAGLDARKTELANLLAERIAGLSDSDTQDLLKRLKNAQTVAGKPLKP